MADNHHWTNANYIKELRFDLCDYESGHEAVDWVAIRTELATVSGRITDAQAGSGVSGVTVRLDRCWVEIDGKGKYNYENYNCNITYATSMTDGTDGNGNYSIQNIAPGVYRIAVIESTYYNSGLKNNVKIKSGHNLGGQNISVQRKPIKPNISHSRGGQDGSMRVGENIRLTCDIKINKGNQQVTFFVDPGGSGGGDLETYGGKTNSSGKATIDLVAKTHWIGRSFFACWEDNYKPKIFNFW